MIRWLSPIALLVFVSCGHARFEGHPQPSRFPSQCQHKLDDIPKGFGFCPHPVSILAERVRSYCRTEYPRWSKKEFPFPFGGPPVFATVRRDGQDYLWVQWEDVSPPGSAAAYSISDGRLLYCERGPSDAVGKFACDYESFGQAPTKRPSPTSSAEICQNLPLFEDRVKATVSP